MKRIILFGLAGLIASTAAIAQETAVNNLVDNGPLEIYIDNDESGDAEFRIRAGDIGDDGTYTGGDVLFEIKPDTTYSNATGVGDMMTTINTDATIAGNTTISGATDLNSTLTVDGAADLNSTLTVDGATTITGSITQTAGNIDFTTASDGSIKMSTAGANGGAFITLDPSSSQSSNLNGKSQDDQSVLIYTTASSGSAGDIDLISADDIEITAIDNIYLDAADDVEIYAIQDLEILAMRLGGETTNTDTNTELTGYGGILAIQGKDTNRYIADANGKIVLLDNTDDWDGQFTSGNPMKDSSETVAAGTTAQLLVGDVQGNMRGLVVQENKTTLSGGQNAASLTLDTRGATFSNPVVSGSLVSMLFVAPPKRIASISKSCMA